MKLDITKLLDIGLIIKAVDSLLEVVGGVLLLRPERISGFLATLSQHSRHDLVARTLQHMAGGVEAATIASALYLVVHGITKIVLIIAAVKRLKWGYVGLIVVLFLFAVFEAYRFVETAAWWLMVIALFDAVLALLVAREYKTRRPSLQTESQAQAE